MTSHKSERKKQTEILTQLLQETQQQNKLLGHLVNNSIANLDPNTRVMLYGKPEDRTKFHESPMLLHIYAQLDFLIANLFGDESEESKEETNLKNSDSIEETIELVNANDTTE